MKRCLAFLPVLAMALLAILPLPAPSARACDLPMFWEMLSTAVTAAPMGVNPVLYNLPDGSGAAFAQARVPGGAAVDATVTLSLMDGGGNPIAGVAAADMWLEREVVAGTGNFNACAGGTIADGPTDGFGIARWTQPLRAGGWSTTRTFVAVCGSYLVSNAGLALRHNSADLNGDLVVNLADVPLFAHDFHGSYAFRSDLQYDGVVNLSDIPRLAGAMGAHCR